MGILITEKQNEDTKRKSSNGAEEMNWWLRALAVYREDPGLVPCIYMVAHNHLSVTPVAGDLIPSAGFHGCYMYVVHRHPCKQNIQTQKMKSKFYKSSF